MPVAISETATYWIDTFNVEVEGKNERFLPDEKVRDRLHTDLIVRLGMAGALTNRGNSDVEDYYTGQLSRFIADDLRGIPSR
ncbi:hypothetical protein SAMN03159443_05186 [Pseudomonas sp. NFACC15-1]|uniref:hypothetical protein n=1 Tax=unclassified Pseudomonas TaxID=196821 RepID=UPI00088CAE74|nr:MULTISPECIES: hypothetical protein [unclassified Pseudomonas]SDA94119.1 hypothetical protein SAMN03159443_05186 [Pseudomonas sp. NFACC15-1]SDZ19995.1 hypothetical protein SAMN03159380_05701 [Pseudomonas sp. NFACC14]